MTAVFKDYPDSCPPTAAQPADGLFFRVVSNPPQATDWQSKFELGEDYPTERDCDARGLSVYNIEKAAEKLKNRVVVYRAAQVVKIKLVPENGMSLKTGGKHHFTWWPFDSFCRTDCILEII